MNSNQSSEKYYIYRLKEELCQRQRVNPAYSLRAFAKYLDLHPASLSAILKDKRCLPIKSTDQVAQKLKLPPSEYKLFVDSVKNSKVSLKNIPLEDDEGVMLNDSYFKIMAEWEHFALLNLLKLKNFRSDEAWMARKLGVSSSRLEVVLGHLLRAGFIRKNDQGEFERQVQRLRTTEDIKSPALRAGHEESLEMGKQMMEDVDVNFRDFSSVVFEADLKNLPKAKQIIREFRQKLSVLMREGQPSEVYRCCIQVYPLTKIDPHLPPKQTN